MILENDTCWLSESSFRSGDVLKAKLISSGWGSSGYYAPKLLESSAKLYRRGTRVFKNHATKSEQRERPERSVNDLMGYLNTDAFYENGALFADIKILPAYVDFVRSASGILGLSHYADGRSKPGTAEGRTGPIIESIDAVHSVDVVTVAGRGGTFLESGRGSVRSISPTEDDGIQELYESYINSGMSESSAMSVIHTITGKPYTPYAPAPALLRDEMTEATEALVQSYIESGMSETVARNIIDGY